MILFMYGSMFVISVAYLIILLMVYKKHITPSYIMLSASIIMSNFGYFETAMAKEVETAVALNHLLYLSSCFTIFFMMLCIAQICKFKIPWFVAMICSLCNLFFFVCSMSVGRTEIFYRSCELVIDNGYSHLVKDYGPLHIAYPIYLLSVMTFCFVIIIITIIRKKDVSKKTCWLSLSIMAVSIGVYGLERLFKSEIEWMPMSYMFSYAVLLIQLNRVRMYNLSGFTMSAIENSNEFGFILFDSYGRYEASDDFAKECFPELKDLKVDSYFDVERSELLSQIQKWIKGATTEEIGHYTCGDKYIAARYTEISERYGRILHCVRLMDETRQQHYTNLIRDYNDKLQRDVSEKTQKFVRVQDDIIISMASIVENRDNNTGGHIQRSSAVVKIFVEHLMEINYLDDLTEDIANMIVKAAPLHDFGKIAIPDSILNKQGKFETWEYDEMKKHSAKGAVIVARILQHSEDIAFRNIAVNIAHYHHEKWDGNGYPEGLTEKEIPFEARVMALADVFDALVSKRVYKESFDYDKAFRIIEESGGNHFDPELCKRFLECRPRLEALYDSFND